MAKNKKTKQKPETKIKQIISTIKDQQYNFLKHQGKIQKLITKWKKFWNPDKLMIANIEMNNGFHKTILIVAKGDGFKYNGKKYLFDNDMKYYNFSLGYWCYDYHEDITLPIIRKTPVNEIKNVIENSNISEVEYALNPSTIERFETSKIAEGIMKGQKLDEFMTKVIVLLFIVVVSTVFHLILYMYKSGVFNSIT